MRFYFKMEKCVVIVESDSVQLTIMMQHALYTNPLRNEYSFWF
jgi:hypothetical protein